MNALNVVFYLALASAVALTIGGLAVPRRRQQLLFAAAGAFGIAGVLGILSIGALFLLAGVVCLVVAARSGVR